MPLGVFFWVFFVIGVVFYGYFGFRSPAPDRPFFFGDRGFFLILIFILGWAQFGFVIQK